MVARMEPDVSHLTVFGCKAFAHVPDEKRTKLESKSMPCVFLRYYEGTKKSFDVSKNQENHQK